MSMFTRPKSQSLVDPAKEAKSEAELELVNARVSRIAQRPVSSAPSPVACLPGLSSEKWLNGCALVPCWNVDSVSAFHIRIE
jgi:hypothetical protein